MKNILLILVSMILAIAASPSLAALNVFACEPEWAALAQELGGDKVETFSATTALQDPHHIEARPSLIAKLRGADVLVCSGADLEAGWLPQLLRQAGNGKVQVGQPGNIEASALVERLEVPQSVDRSQGDVHAAGNPHVQLDPRRVLTIAEALSARLASIDTGSADVYKSRLVDFRNRWQQAISRWEQQAQPLKGMKVVVHHKEWVYLFHWLGIEEVAALEAVPGVPPSATHLAQLKAQLAKQPARAIVRSAYQDGKPSQWLAEQTGLPAVVLPYTVGGSDKASNLFLMFDDTVARLLTVAK